MKNTPNYLMLIYFLFSFLHLNSLLNQIVFYRFVFTGKKIKKTDQIDLDSTYYPNTASSILWSFLFI